MENSENTQYVSFLDDHRAREEGSGPFHRASPSPASTTHDDANASINNDNASPSASIMRKLIQSHRYKSRVAAVIGLLAVFCFALAFYLLHSSSPDVEKVIDSDSGIVASADWATPPSDMYRRRELDFNRYGGNIGGKISGNPDEVWNWSEEQFQGAFNMWATTFSKKYEDENERGQRYAIFRRNMMYIATHNMQGFSYTLAMNEFGDLTRDEFKARYLGFDSKYQTTGKNLASLSGTSPRYGSVSQDENKAVPEALDWRKKGCVQPVKNQGQCGSCWAFSATGSMEGAACAQMGKHVSLSEQQLVDCAKKEGNNGCSGGQMEGAFQYVINHKGLCSEDDYPYHAKDEKCKCHQCKSVIQLESFKNVKPKDEKALEYAIATFGPVAVGIEADEMPFQFYHDGVFDGSCGSVLDHGVLAVGYGTDEGTGRSYWIVKNSWGPKWGDHGYIKLARNVGPYGQCGILLDPSFPVVGEVPTPAPSEENTLNLRATEPLRV